jgi:hypothetical protein
VFLSTHKTDSSGNNCRKTDNNVDIPGVGHGQNIHGQEYWKNFIGMTFA